MRRGEGGLEGKEKESEPSSERAFLKRVKNSKENKVSAGPSLGSEESTMMTSKWPFEERNKGKGEDENRNGGRK